MKDNRAYIRRILIAITSIGGVYYAAAKKGGVKGSTFDLLYALSDDKPHTQKSICDEWLIPPTTINTAIKECKDNGYVTLIPIPGQKREMEICLTEKGKDFTEKIFASFYNVEQEAIKRTLDMCGLNFIDDLEQFGACLKDTFSEEGFI